MDIYTVVIIKCSPTMPAKGCYFIVLDEADQVIGGVGIAEFNGIEDCAEMQKLYLDDSAKCKG